jgi:hypothetical protein
VSRCTFCCRSHSRHKNVPLRYLAPGPNSRKQDSLPAAASYTMTPLSRVMGVAPWVDLSPLGHRGLVGGRRARKQLSHARRHPSMERVSPSPQRDGRGFSRLPIWIRAKEENISQKSLFCLPRSNARYRRHGLTAEYTGVAVTASLWTSSSLRRMSHATADCDVERESPVSSASLE